MEPLRAAVPGARWVPRDNLHVTLKFLGWVEPHRVAEIGDAVGTATAGMVSFDVALTSLGAFPATRRARVVWIALDDPAGGLRALAGALDEALAPLGFPAESRSFTAHLTIARLKEPSPVTLPETELAERMRVDRLILFRSHLGRPAPRYEAIATYPF